ncbi:MAG: HAMP domain-containing histidine kinase [Chloroflexi bacterium]|nr:HAMP domain-containing histidine kinase [Chloroflexota bacterium]
MADTELDSEIESLQNQVDTLSRLVQVSLVMNSTLRLQPLLEFIMHVATDITDAEAASILLVDQRTKELQFAAATGSVSSNLIGMVVPIKGSVAGAIIAEDRALIIDDTTRDRRHFQGVEQATGFQTRSILGVPMRIRDKLIGVLEVINKREGRFNEDDVRHITILSSQAAVAIENAQLVSEIRAANEELSGLNKMKNDFISIASHELRTPLGVILGYASFLKDEAQGEASEHAEMVLNSALHLRNLIEDMTNLRYVQIDEGDLKIEATSVNEILNTVHADVLRLAQAQAQHLVYQRPDQLIHIQADKTRMAMAVTNVLNNAVKFTPQSGVIVLSVTERDNEIWIQVQDNGPGIPRSDLERIFDQFYQVGDVMTRRHNGMGLGLTIAKAVVMRHNGRIWADSGGEGHGATFTIALPTSQPQQQSNSEDYNKRISGTRPLSEL